MCIEDESFGINFFDKDGSGRGLQGIFGCCAEDGGIGGLQFGMGSFLEPLCAGFDRASGKILNIYRAIFIFFDIFAP